MTTADQIAARFNDDGQCFTDANGISIESACEAACVSSQTHRSQHATVYTFADGSRIVVGDWWDCLDSSGADSAGGKWADEE